jgi:hypothetical protein
VKSVAGFLLALEIVDVDTAQRSCGAIEVRCWNILKSPNARPTSRAGSPTKTRTRFKVYVPRVTTGSPPSRSGRVLFLRSAFSSHEARLINGARWFFDSYSGANELLSFVQAMVVLEILFGDQASSDVIGIGQLIANRCAYLIGRTVDQRDRIIRDINVSTAPGRQSCTEGKTR